MAKKKYDLREVRNVCIYARYSPGSRQTDQSIKGQIAVCKEFAQEQGYRVVKLYCDKKQTGTNDDRAEFRQMIADSARGIFDAVIVWKNDRFGRNLEDQVLNEVRIKRNGVRLISATEPVAEGALGGMQKAMLMGMAEFYSATNSENVSRGLRENAKKCLVTSGAIPFGYRKGADKRYEIDPPAAAMVQEIYARYDAGENLFPIMDDVNARGFKTWMKKPFTRNTMYTVLKNEKYTGVYIFKDIRIEGGVPQIIDRELWERVQKRLKQNKHAPARSKAAEPFLLTTKCFCGNCGGNMVGESGTSKTGTKHYYYCCVKRKNARIKVKACQKKSIRKDALEQLVIRKTIDYVLAPRMIDQIATELMEYQRNETENIIIEQLLDNQKRVQKAVDNLLDMVEAGDITPALSKRLKTREEELETINIAIAEQELVREKFTREELIFYLQQFQGGDANDPIYCKRIIDTFVNSVFVYDDKIVVVYNFTGDDGDRSRVTIEDVRAAMEHSEEKEKGEAPVQGSLSDNFELSSSSDNVGLVQMVGLEPTRPCEH